MSASPRALPKAASVFPTPFKLLFTKREAAFSLGMSTRTLDRYIAAKRISARRVGEKVMIHIKELERFARCDSPVVK